MSYDRSKLNGTSHGTVKGKEESGEARRLVEQALEFLGISEWVTYRNVISNGLYLFFVLALGVIYVANTHSAERTIRKINQKEKALKELRWEHMTLKSDLKHAQKQSELADKLSEIGIMELQEPPNRIVVSRRAY